MHKTNFCCFTNCSKARIRVKLSIADDNMARTLVHIKLPPITAMRISYGSGLNQSDMKLANMQQVM